MFGCATRIFQRVDLLFSSASTYFLLQVLQNLDFRTKSDLFTLETRWDIANHPVKPDRFQVRRRTEGDPS